MNSPWLHRFAVCTAFATLALLGVGGLVTSHGVGMAVPDWPNTYGYNMFFFPVSKWVGGIFYEHTHRLVASVVGFATAVLALWLHGRHARPFLRWTGVTLLILPLGAWAALPGHWTDALVLGATGLAAFGASFGWPSGERSTKGLRRLGLAAFFAVVLQGVLGGLRVVLFKDAIGIFHAALAQVFFVLVCSIALFTSPWWRARQENREARNTPLLSGLSPAARLALTATVLVFAQLLLGATMRHQHAGLAIPDFPLAYGKLWPSMDAASVQLYNQHRLEVTEANPITAVQIGLQMAHRLLALLILVAVAACAWLTARLQSGNGLLRRLTLAWLGLILVQVLLGAATIWSGKAADIATAHVIVGALSLVLGCFLVLLQLELVPSHRRRATFLDCASPYPA